MARRIAARCTTSYRNAAGVGASPSQLATTKRSAESAGSGHDPRGLRTRSKSRQASFLGVDFETRSAEERHRQGGAIDTRVRAGFTPAYLAAEGFRNDRHNARRGSQSWNSSEPTAVGPWASARPMSGSVSDPAADLQAAR
jgi:hypothetical protein